VIKVEDKSIEAKTHSLLEEKINMVDKQVTRLEKLIGISGVTEKGQETPMVSKFDIYANRLSGLKERLLRCNTEVEKL